MSIADGVNKFIGSWTFIIIQSVIVVSWVGFNILSIYHKFDPYPFILLNLFFSTEAAYATPLILMSSIRQAEKEAKTLQHDIDLAENTNATIVQLYTDIKEMDKDIIQINTTLLDIKDILKEFVALNKPDSAPTGDNPPTTLKK